MPVSGEAGVGKTVLVHEACDRVRPTADVVWASCLPLTSLAVPLLPLTAALRRWASDAARSNAGPQPTGCRRSGGRAHRI